jgi:hypothetical protein
MAIQGSNVRGFGGKVIYTKIAHVIVFEAILPGSMLRTIPSPYLD